MLLAALAEHAVPVTGVGLPRTLDTADLRILARTAAPTSPSDSRPAVVIDIPLVGGVTTGVDAERIIRFRQQPGTERARQDYLDAVGRYINGRVRRDPSLSASDVASQKLSHDLELASKSWVERAKGVGMPTVALTTISTLTPFHPEGVSEWVGMTAGAVAVGMDLVTAVRKSHVHGYLNSARRAGVMGG